MLSIIDFVMTCISVLTNTFNIVLGLIILVKFATSERRTWDITFMTAIYFYTSMLLFSCILFSLGFTTFLGDIDYYVATDSIGCRALGHLFVFCGSFMLNAFPLEAFTRCCIVVYRQNLWLRSMQAMTIYIAITICYSIVVVSIGIPLYNVKYEPSEFTCTIDFLEWKGIVYAMAMVYLAPLTLLTIVYTIVVNHMRRSTQAVQNYQQRVTHRDFRVLTRIVILTCVAAVITLPSTIICIVGIVTGQVYNFTYRVEIIATSLWVGAIETGLIFVNPQIKSLLLRGIGRGQVEPTPAVERR